MLNPFNIPSGMATELQLILWGKGITFTNHNAERQMLQGSSFSRRSKR